MRKIHPGAIIEKNVTIGENAQIWHFVHLRKGCIIGKNCKLGKDVYIDQKVVVGDNVKIQNFVSVYQGVRIEDDVFVGPAVTFTNDFFPRAWAWNEQKSTPTLIKKGASIGANATILCGIAIGEYAMVGAGSVVTKNVPPFTLVYGNPAKIKGVVCFCGQKIQDRNSSYRDKLSLTCPVGKRRILKDE